MQQHLRNILSAAGVAVNADNNNEDNGGGKNGLDGNDANNMLAFSAMEAWLSMKNTALGDDYGTDDTTVEDCLPLSDGVFRATVDWLVDVWGGSDSSFISTHHQYHRNNLISRTRERDLDTITLESAFGSVRATRYLRAWMEFNLDTGESADYTLLARLLRADFESPDIARPEFAKKSPRNALLRSIYDHIRDLPQIQQQINRFGQFLQRGDPHSMSSSSNPQTGTTALSDPSSRLHQYELSLSTSTRLQQEWEEHIERLQCILGELYRASCVEQRRMGRRLLGKTWAHFVSASSTNGGSGGLRQEYTQAASISMTLNVLLRIVLGGESSERVSPQMEHLLFHQLIPLHKADGIVLWRDQMAVLELYHEPLCKCMATILMQDPNRLVPFTVVQLLHSGIFPKAGNTPKQVLLLHEINTYISLFVPVIEPSADMNTDMDQSTQPTTTLDYLKSEESMMKALCHTLGRCMSSEHSRIAEQALQFIQNKSFEKLLIGRHLKLGLTLLLPALVKREPSWNPTVRKMTYNVLNQLQVYDEDLFKSISNSLFHEALGVNEEDNSSESNLSTNVKIGPILATQTEESASDTGSYISDLSLKAGMGNWRPSPMKDSVTSSGTSMPPPSRIGGKMKPGRGSAPWSTASSTDKEIPTAPPLTVTGVAPWAIQPGVRGNSRRAPVPVKPLHSRSTLPRPKRRAQDSQLTDVSENSDTQAPTVDGSKLPESENGMQYVLQMMKKLKPPDEENGISSWSRTQMEETPIYLPSLKFHGLVFGHELGKGAFGSVKYARLIDKAKTRSLWPEYAVKIVSTEKIRELGYESSIQQEIAVLRILSHPGIARLVSSFRFQDGAYLVLEYASKGDLHALLRKNGSLDIESTRFVVGEIVAALASIHELGFVYGDLKPENCVVTETGHLKLTDFGGCRPVTMEAKAKIKVISKTILKDLRDGDWKVKAEIVSLDSADNNGAVEDEKDDSMASHDCRVEGTTAYLPPEVVMGEVPTLAADSWALGCVMYQCLSGRPPLLEDDDSATKSRIVNFHGRYDKGGLEQLFVEKFASGISPEAQDIIRSLLARDATKRPGMQQVADHVFFLKDVFSLYKEPAYPIDAGSVTPAPDDAKWTRRQFSSIWAPQPKAIDVSMSAMLTDQRGSYVDELSAIAQGPEATTYFSASGNAMNLAESKKQIVPARMLPI